MKTSDSTIRKRMSVIVMLCLLMFTTPVLAQWTQWGGPNRDFTVDTSGLADTWPKDGPKTLWHRTLGSGFSSIIVDDGKLYTMYRTNKKNGYEHTIALDAATGKTIWKKRTLAVIPRKTLDYGKEFTGPNSTPLIVGDRLFTVGRNAILNCYQKSDGTVLWTHNLVSEFGAETQVCGYSPSPIAFRDTIILPMGHAEDDKREDNSLVAFDQTSGDIVWKRHTFKIEHSTPILINLDGKQHLVQCTNRALIGVNPKNGDLLWEYGYPDPERYIGIFASPVWNGEDIIMFSSRDIGCAVKLTTVDGRTNTDLLWSSNQLPLGMGTPVLFGDLLVGAKRPKGSPMSRMLGVDIRSGELLWDKQVFPSPVIIGGSQKLIILDHNGVLGLATATREGMTIHSQHQLTERYSFSAPTLVGSTLYVRDEKNIMALDVGKIPTDTSG